LLACADEDRRVAAYPNLKRLYRSASVECLYLLRDASIPEIKLVNTLIIPICGERKQEDN